MALFTPVNVTLDVGHPWVHVHFRGRDPNPGQHWNVRCALMARRVTVGMDPPTYEASFLPPYLVDWSTVRPDQMRDYTAIYVLALWNGDRPYDMRFILIGGHDSWQQQENALTAASQTWGAVPVNRGTYRPRIKSKI